MSDFMTDFAGMVRHVCQEGKTELQLDTEATLNFFRHRKQWEAAGVLFRSIPGQLVQLDLPSFPLPVRTITREAYLMDGIIIRPAFEYHSIVHYFYRNRFANLIPGRSSEPKYNEVSHVY